MLYTKYCQFITNITRIGQKIINRKIYLFLPHLFHYFKMKQLEITFRIASNSNYENGFITMLMLTEKMTNNKPIFLLDKNTLSKNKTIKIGLVIFMKNEVMDYYLKLCCIHSVPKFYSHGILFSVSNKTSNFSYIISKILSNTQFSFDKDINSYYDYLGELPYELDFLFRTYFRNIAANKLLISSRGIHFVNRLDSNVISQIDEVETMISLEEDNSDNDSDLDSDLNSDLDSDLDSYLYNNSYSDSDNDSDSESDLNCESNDVQSNGIELENEHEIKLESNFKMELEMESIIKFNIKSDITLDINTPITAFFEEVIYYNEIDEKIVKMKIGLNESVYNILRIHYDI